MLRFLIKILHIQKMFMDREAMIHFIGGAVGGTAGTSFSSFQALLLWSYTIVIVLIYLPRVILVVMLSTVIIFRNLYHLSTRGHKDEDAIQ